MKTRKLGRSGLEVSPFAFGGNVFGWTIDEPTLNFTWTEKYGPLVQPPTTQSFGTRLISSLGKQLNADVRLTYEPSGFVYALDVPTTSLISPVTA